MCPDLVIQTLGSTAIWIGEDAIHERVSVKAQALLIYLAVTRQTHTREALAEFLWESRAPGQALTNLRKIIIQLQSIVPYLCITRRAMGLTRITFTGWTLQSQSAKSLPWTIYPRRSARLLWRD